MRALIPTLGLAAALVLSPVSQAVAQPPAVKEVALPSLAPLIESVKGAVVNVDVQKRALNDEQMQMFERYFRNRRQAHPEVPLNAGMGSGFIIDESGLVLTNNHVVDGAVTIRVRLDDGRSFDAEVLGRDPLTDVALVKIKGTKGPLPYVKLGSSGEIKVGDWVVAIGNPFGLASSVSAGIISALDRDIGMGRYDQFLQTDAAINPGNSGGPLFNLKGEVVGINSAIVGQATGIGFAVPSDLVKALLPQLEKKGYVTRGWLGVQIQDVTPVLGRAMGSPVSEGALVGSVNENSPAKKGGVREEDIVVAIDGEKVRSGGDLTRIVALKKPETTVGLTVYRGKRKLELKVKLGTRPDLEGIGSIKPAVDTKDETHARIGLSFQDVDPRIADSEGVPRQGALVVDVAPGSAAEKAGLKRGMVVVEVNRKAVRSRDDLLRALKGTASGAAVLVRVALPGGGGRSLLGLEVP